MICSMERKKKWSSTVYESLADAIDELATEKYRGDKWIAISAACFSFLMMDDDDQQKFIDCIKLGEVRGGAGTVYQASKEMYDKLKSTDAKPTLAIVVTKKKTKKGAS